VTAELLAGWIQQNVIPAKSINLDWPERALRHVARSAFGHRVNVRRADFEAAMVAAGYEPVIVPGRGPHYRLKFIGKLKR